MRSLEVWDWCPKKSPVEDLLDMLHLVESGQIISLLICSYLLSLIFFLFSQTTISQSCFPSSPKDTDVGPYHPCLQRKGVRSPLGGKNAQTGKPLPLDRPGGLDAL